MLLGAAEGAAFAGAGISMIQIYFWAGEDEILQLFTFVPLIIVGVSLGAWEQIREALEPTLWKAILLTVCFVGMFRCRQVRLASKLRPHVSRNDQRKIDR